MVEPAEINCYIENPQEETPSQADELAYLRQRYREILQAYQTLLLQLSEAEGTDNAAMTTQLTKLFEGNYKTRRYLVQRLRELGEDVADRWVPILDHPPLKDGSGDAGAESDTKAGETD